jgi:hypothetical protein
MHGIGAAEPRHASIATLLDEATFLLRFTLSEPGKELFLLGIRTEARPRVLVTRVIGPDVVVEPVEDVPLA